MTKILAALLLTVSAIAAADSTVLPSNSEIVNRAIAFAKAHSGDVNTLNNVLRVPDLKVGNSFDFGTIMTLKAFDCSQDRGDTVCAITVQYCILRNEYPPLQQTETVRMTGSNYDVINVSEDSQDLPDSACN